MKPKRAASPTITESEWLAELEADYRAAHKPPPPGFFSFATWCRLLDRGTTVTQSRLAELVRLGLVERQEFRAPDASGRITLRPFWKRTTKKQ